MATFMDLLDTSISNVSRPHIAGGLGTSYDESTWVQSTCILVSIPEQEQQGIEPNKSVPQLAQQVKTIHEGQHRRLLRHHMSD